jgi:2-aminoadipate transaminase
MDDSVFADRVTDVPPSFIREILKVALNHKIISFAGGLPNRQLFPIEEIKAATKKVLDHRGRDVLQYSNSEEYIELRKLISQRYLAKKNIQVPVENILITNGSQQGLDLLGKTMLNDGDALIIEEPGYLGAIQAFSIYKPSFKTVTVNDEGMDVNKLKKVLSAYKPKLLYSVPNFQNPSGISCSEENRQAAAEVIEGKTFLSAHVFWGADLEKQALFFSELRQWSPRLQDEWFGPLGCYLRNIFLAKVSLTATKDLLMQFWDRHKVSYG